MGDLSKLVLGAVSGGGEGKRIEAKVARLAVGAGEHVSGGELEPVHKQQQAFQQPRHVQQYLTHTHIQRQTKTES